MPRVKIDIREGRTDAHKQQLMDGIHNALVESIKIPEYDRIQILHEHKAYNFEIPPLESEMYTIIEITMFVGRSIEAKKNLYQAITRNLEQIHLTSEDIMIILIEPSMANWGIRGIPASEINLGFKIDV